MKKIKFLCAEDKYALKKGHWYTGFLAGNYLASCRGVLVKFSQIQQLQKEKKEKSLTSTNYKDFSDLCFEVGIRYRDKWTSVISGKRFPEGSWNDLQAGHGQSRGHWDTRHNPYNCHAITSGENFHMSLGTTSTIIKYWRYVERQYGQKIHDELVDYEHKPVKLTIAFLKEECKKCYAFLCEQVAGNKLTPDEIIHWRCQKLPKAKAEGILKILETMEK